MKSNYPYLRHFRPLCLLRACEESYEILESDAVSVTNIAVRLIDNYVARRFCPRCGGPNTGQDGKRTLIGSHATQCRCIPICMFCARAEQLQGSIPVAWNGSEDDVLFGMFDYGCASWPLDPRKQRSALFEWHRRYPHGDPFEGISLPNLYWEERPCEHEREWDLPGGPTFMDSTELRRLGRTSRRARRSSPAS